MRSQRNTDSNDNERHELIEKTNLLIRLKNRGKKTQLACWLVANIDQWKTVRFVEKKMRRDVQENGYFPIFEFSAIYRRLFVFFFLLPTPYETPAVVRCRRFYVRANAINQ